MTAAENPDRPDVLEVYETGEEQPWRWRLLAPNGRKLSNPGESFRTLATAAGNGERVTKRPVARVVRRYR